MVNRLAERGVAQIVLILIILAGIAGGVYLVQEGPKIFKPKASELRPSSPETSFKLVNASLSKAEVVVKLYARSDISAANVFSAKINFPKDLLEVTSIETESEVSSISKGPQSLVKEVFADEKECEHDSDCQSGYFCVGKDASKRLGIPWDTCAKEEDKNVSGNTAIGGECKWDGDCKAPAGEKRGYCCTAEDCGTRQYKCTNKDGTIPGSGSTQSGTSGSARSVNLNWSERTPVEQANKEGTLSLIAQAPNPGVKTNTSQDSLLLATIKFKAKGQGEANISFDDSSQIFSNSANTNILTKKTGVTIQLGTGQTQADSLPLDSAYAVKLERTQDRVIITATGPDLSKEDSYFFSLYRVSEDDYSKFLLTDRIITSNRLTSGQVVVLNEPVETILVGCRAQYLSSSEKECKKFEAEARIYRMKQGSIELKKLAVSGNQVTLDFTSALPAPTLRVEPSKIKIGDTYKVIWSNGSTDKPDTIRLTEDSGSEWTIFTTSCDEPTQGDFRDVSGLSPKPNDKCKFNGGEEQVLTFQLINSKGEAIGNSVSVTNLAE